MNSEKLIALVKRWNKLEAEQKDLDYRKAEWAREARGCFQDDRRFIAWCKADLGLTDAAAQDLCLRARAAGIVTDAKTWIQVGGMRQIRAVEDLSKREQMTVLEAAKSSGRAIRTIVKERHPVAAVLPIRSMGEKIKDSDAAILAKFIAENEHKLGKLPGSIDVIVRMYAPRKFKVAA